MNIAILGTGAIGSAFAFHLSKAGHTVTTIARGPREQQLRAENAIVLTSGERAAVTVAGQLDTSITYDLVIVTVLAPQVAAVLPALKASAAKTVMFMFNTFDSLEPLIESVGRRRAAFGFPMGILGRLIDGKLKHQVRSGTTVGDAQWAKLFTDAGISTVVEKDMQSWLRAHAALVIPLMASSVKVVEKNAGNTWAEASAYATALETGLRTVRDMGHTLTPGFLGALLMLPRFVNTLFIWALSRLEMTRELGALGPAEARMLIDMMHKAVPEKSGPLLAIKP